MTRLRANYAWAVRAAAKLLSDHANRIDPVKLNQPIVTRPPGPDYRVSARLADEAIDRARGRVNVHG